jgi:hypothetical protein
VGPAPVDSIKESVGWLASKDVQSPLKLT